MDLKISWDGQAYEGDWLAGEDETGFDSAVLISLFSDARARDDDSLPATENNRRGWWGEALHGPAQFGCRWWLRMREKQTAEVARLWADDAHDALAWMIEDGVASSIDVTTHWASPGVLAFGVAFALSDGSRRLLEGSMAP